MKKRDVKGRFVSYRPLLRLFFGVSLVYAVSTIGWNTITKALETAFTVENSLADIEFHVPTWQEEVLLMIKNVGLDVELADKIIQHESWWNPENTHVNKDGTKDRGLWMLHEVYHAEVSDSCAYDWFCSTREAIRIWKERGPQEWVAYKYVK